MAMSGRRRQMSTGVIALACLPSASLLLPNVRLGRRKEKPVTVMAEATDSIVTDPRSLITPDLFTQLVGRIVKDEQVDQQYAERIMVQALAFLKACALSPGRSLAPSEAIDPAWHVFILHTSEYAAFCQHIAGRFIHHRPDRLSGEPTDPVDAIGTTVAAMRDLDLPVDEELWSAPTNCQKCNECTTQCHS
ncbi:MAG: hypothetical protein JWL97_4198 [Gemmatimonadales bacterium]|jgi:hypothetical protein|nr:hypothetical protein [Gemmatimonadales bacterium]